MSPGDPAPSRTTASAVRPKTTLTRPSPVTGEESTSGTAATVYSITPSCATAEPIQLCTVKMHLLNSTSVFCGITSLVCPVMVPPVIQRFTIAKFTIIHNMGSITGKAVTGSMPQIIIGAAPVARTIPALPVPTARTTTAALTRSTSTLNTTPG